MAAGATTEHHAEEHRSVLSEILEARDHLDPGLLAAGDNTDDALALAGACLGLPVYARELNRHGLPRLWPFGAGYAVGRRYDELLLACAYLIAAYEDDQTESGRSWTRLQVHTDILAARAGLADPYGVDPAKSTKASAADALAFAGACYALPAYARELGLQGVPLLWPWPRTLYRSEHRGRDLVTAVAMFIAEMQRQAHAARRRRPTLAVLLGGAGS